MSDDDEELRTVTSRAHIAPEQAILLTNGIPRSASAQQSSSFIAKIPIIGTWWTGESSGSRGVQPIDERDVLVNRTEKDACGVKMGIITMTIAGFIVLAVVWWNGLI